MNNASAAEKALVNFSSPLLAVDEMPMSKRYSTQTVKLTAGLHRQTWISGYLVFVDMHIENKSSKDVKKVEVQLEKTTLFHNYPAPSTNTGSADVLRLPDHRQTEIVVRKDLADGFQGVRSLSQVFRTCQLELPTGLVSIETGVYFQLGTAPMRKSSSAQCSSEFKILDHIPCSARSNSGDRSLTILPRAILWHPLLLEYSNKLLAQVCLPEVVPHLFLAHSVYL